MINFSAVRPESISGRLVRYPFKLLPHDLALPILQGPLRGKKWIVGSHLHGCWLGSYEFQVQRRIASEIQDGDVFYDVGANVGFYSLIASMRTGALGFVYAFEPLPANTALLQKHLQINRVRNVEILEMAVADCAGISRFAREPTRAMGRLEAKGDVTVAVSTLDSLLAEGRIAPPSTIKVDIEGCEARALAGAAECFRKFRPKLFLATHGNEVHDQCCQLLSEFGYQWTYLAREKGERAELFAVPK